MNFDLNEEESTVKMDAVIRFCSGLGRRVLFLQSRDAHSLGQVFAVPGDFMAVSADANPIGSLVGQTIQDERNHTENGREIIDATTAGIQIEAVREPLKIRLLQFSAAHELLASEEFEPGAVPEQIVPLAAADYLLLETIEKGPDGESFIRREAIGRDVDYLNTLSCRDDGICLFHYHDVFWNGIVPEENAAEEPAEAKETV